MKLVPEVGRFEKELEGGLKHPKPRVDSSEEKLETNPGKTS